MIKSVMSIIRLLVFFASIAYLIFSCTSKTKERLVGFKHCILANMGYAFADMFIFNTLFDLDTGLEVLIYFGGNVIVFILSIIALIIISARRKKIEPAENGKKSMLALLYIVPIVMLSLVFVSEIRTLSQANLILTNDPADWSGDYYTIVVSDDKASRVEIGDVYFPKGGSEKDYQVYHVGFNDEYFEIKTYDEAPSEEQTEILQALYKFDGFEKTDAKNHYSGGHYMHAQIIKIDDSDYYIVDWILSDTPSVTGGGSVYGSAIFLGTKFIDDIHIFEIEDIILYK